MTVELTIWKHPSDYGGFSPDGHIVVMSVHRNSDSLSRSNWIEARAMLAEAAGLETIPADDAESPVYDWRANHWAVGWVEYLMARPDASQAVLDCAQLIADKLEGYPVLNEDAWSELEYAEACEYWESASVRERAELIRDSHCNVSVFAARRAELPSDDSGALLQHLNGY